MGAEKGAELMDACTLCGCTGYHHLTCALKTSDMQATVERMSDADRLRILRYIALHRPILLREAMRSGGIRE